MTTEEARRLARAAFDANGVEHSDCFVCNAALLRAFATAFPEHRNTYRQTYLERHPGKEREFDQTYEAID